MQDSEKKKRKIKEHRVNRTQARLKKIFIFLSVSHGFCKNAASSFFSLLDDSQAVITGQLVER